MKFVKFSLGAVLLALLSYGSIVVMFHAASSVILPQGDAPADWRE